MIEQLDDFSLNGKIVVITGSGSGIGFELAKLCFQRNCSVIVADIRLSPEAKGWIEGPGEQSPRVHFVQTDVAIWKDMQRLVSISAEKFGDIPDLYVAAAGVFEPEWSNFWNDPETDRYRSVDINVSHPIKFTRIAIRALLQKNKKGVIVIVSSIAGQAPNFSAPLYVATKHALCGFTRSLSGLEEYAGIKVVASAPGMVWTRIWTDQPDKIAGYHITEDVCLHPRVVAESIITLAESHEYHSGSVLEVSKDGTRLVPAFNAPPPAGAGVNPQQSEAERRIMRLLDAERTK